MHLLIPVQIIANKRPYHYQNRSCLRQLMNSQPAPELRLEPCGLRRHDIAGVSNVYELFHGDRIEGESDSHLAAVHSAGQLSESADTSYEIDSL